ncbi:MAG: divalent-cation tolerance protein CutA [Candidatus Xiphinematobacter sp.]|nr:MAG: divalent-cation tolerance protein CutA [Candidatus Xiphinematobacter sp.]
MIQLVLTTFPSPVQARRTARQLVQARLAACGTLLPRAISIYTWNGNLEENRECLLLLKTTSDYVERLQAAIQRMHPYSVPEILSFEADSCLAAYAAWVKQSLATQSEGA